MRRFNRLTLVLILIFTFLVPVLLSAHAAALAAPSIKSAAVSGTSIVVKWGAVKNAVRYEVYRSLNGAGSVKLGQVKGTSFTEKSVKPGAKYSYKVRATDAQGMASKFSSVKSVTVPVPAPVLSGVSQKDGQVSVTWKAVKGAKYELHRSVDGKAFSKLASITVTSYTDKKVTLGSTYAYKVLAIISGTKSAFSASKSVKLPLPAPNFYGFRIFNTQAILSWSKVPGAEAYQVFRSVDGAGYKLLRTTSRTDLKQDNLTPGVHYAYRVRAVVGENTSAYSDVRSAYALAKPMPVDLYVTGNKADMFWDSVPNAAQYTVYILNPDSDKFEESISIPQPDPLKRLNTGYADLPYGKSTSFYIEASANNTASRSEILTVFPLAAPVVKSTVINGDTMEITWTVSGKNPPDTVYRLRETSMNNYLWNEVVLKPEGGSLQVSYTKKIGIGEKRKFKIRAEYSGYQSELNTRLFHMVGTPTEIFVQQRDEDLAVRWHAAEGARYYWLTLYDDDTGVILSNTLNQADRLETSVYAGPYLGKNIRARVSAVGEYLCGARANAEPVYMMKEPSFKTRVVDNQTGRVMLMWSHVPGSAYHSIACDGEVRPSSGIKQFFGSYWFDDGIRKPGSYIYTIRAINQERGYQEFTIRVRVPEPTDSD